MFWLAWILGGEGVVRSGYVRANFSSASHHLKTVLLSVVGRNLRFAQGRRSRKRESMPSGSGFRGGGGNALSHVALSSSRTVQGCTRGSGPRHVEQYRQGHVAVSSRERHEKEKKKEKKKEREEVGRKEKEKKKEKGKEKGKEKEKSEGKGKKVVVV